MKKVKKARPSAEDPKMARIRRLRPKKRAKKATSKGALIKGMTKRLPHEILRNPLFQDGLRSVMRGYSGIYALYRGERLYYVGLTSELFGRIRLHQRDRHAKKWDSFVIFRIKRINYLKDIETLLMHLISTPGNRVKGKLPKDADINHVLRAVHRNESAELRKIAKALR